jgi:subtilisin family serine protease
MAASAQGGVTTYSSGYYSQSGAPTQTADSWSVATPYNGSNQIIVAVVDTGLDSTHKVFQPYALSAGVNTGGTGSLWVNSIEANGVTGVDDDGNGYVDDIHGWNFINNTNNYYDDDGHGTHVSGIVVGTGLNIFANPLKQSKILIMPLKFLDATGSGSTANAVRAIYYAVDNGARVINNSWGGSAASSALLDALTYAYNHQVVVASAAGNYSKNNDSTPMYPANYDVPSNISVAATTDSDSLAYFSNYGANSVHIGSPGMNIYSTIPDNYYGYMSGTSMATPFVAGMAAMALSEAPNLTGYQLKNLILAQGDNDSGLSGKTTSSARINSYKLIQGAQAMVYAKAYQPGYNPDYSSLDLASSSDPNGAKGGCGLVSTSIISGPGTGYGNPLGVMAGLMLLPLIVWMILRRRAEEPQSRRKYERFKMNSEIRVQIGDRELVGAMNTISMGGLSFNVDQALERGGVVTMRIASPDGHESIEVQGQIVWSEQNQAYGVQFSNAHEGAKAMIKHWTQSLVKS